MPLYDIGAFLVILFIWINARYESNREGIELNENFNCIQQAAYDLIQSDARFIYTIVDIRQNAKNIDSNYILMSQPYIGIFTDGAEQWSKKVGLNFPQFSGGEKEYYTILRNSHKLFELNYKDFELLILNKFKEHDDYFYKIRSLRERLLGYYNVGTDLIKEKFCGNTILCDLYTPVNILGNRNVGIFIKEMSRICGAIAAHFGCVESGSYKYNKNLRVTYKDFHFYKNCPLKVKTNLGFVLFSILCSLNYVIEFINLYFEEEIPQKLKFAYLLYYYLCDFIQDINSCNNTNFMLNSSYKNRNFRNCIAHYGLGQYLNETEIVEDDLLKGLTYKAFDLDYFSTKNEIYKLLNDLICQIENYIF